MKGQQILIHVPGFTEFDQDMFDTFSSLEYQLVNPPYSSAFKFIGSHDPDDYALYEVHDPEKAIRTIARYIRELREEGFAFHIYLSVTKELS